MTVRRRVLLLVALVTSVLASPAAASATHFYSTRAEAALEALITTSSKCCSIATLYTHAGATIGNLPTADGTSGQALITNGAGVWSFGTPGGLAPSDATFVTLSTNATLTNERVLTGTANQITITDNGAGSTVVVSIPAAVTLGTITSTSLQGIIGNVTPAAGTFTTVTATTSVVTPTVSSTAALTINPATTVNFNGHAQFGVNSIGFGPTIDGAQDVGFARSSAGVARVTDGGAGSGTLNAANFNGIIGATTPAAGTFTTVTANTSVQTPMLQSAAGAALIGLGGTTSSFPAIKRSGAGLIVRLADDSANAALTALSLTTNGDIVSGGFVEVQEGDNLRWGAGTRSRISAPADNQLLFRGSGADFGRLMFGGSTSGFPALKRSSATLQVRLADDSDYAALVASGYSAGASAGQSVTTTVRDAAGTGTCTLIFTGGLKTGGTC